MTTSASVPGSKDSVVVAAGGKSQTFDDGLLKSIIRERQRRRSEHTVSIPACRRISLRVTVNDDGSKANDSVTVGGTGALANVAGTVSVNNTFSARRRWR